MNHIQLSVNSACVQAPNALTPNADGINDHFVVYATNITGLQTTIFRTNGTVAMSSTDPYPVWSDLDSTDVGRYRVIIQATTTSGITLSGWSHLDVLAYDANMCLHHSAQPVTGDQFDPRICGVTYATNDIFCP